MSKTKIKCPNCAFEVNVDEVLEHQAQEKFRKEYEEKLSLQAVAYNKKKDEVEGEILKLKRLKEEQDDIIRKKLEEQKEKLRSDAFMKAKKDVEFEMLKIKQDFE